MAARGRISRSMLGGMKVIERDVLLLVVFLAGMFLGLVTLFVGVAESVDASQIVEYIYNLEGYQKIILGSVVFSICAFLAKRRMRYI